MSYELENEKYIQNFKYQYPQYFSDNSYVFKSCQTNYIVILKKDQTTKTNEKRFNISSSKCAKLRANKLLVVNIINKFDPSETLNSITNSIYKDSQKDYVIGKIITSRWNSDLSIINTEGIHYFNTIEPAFYSELFFLTKKFGGKWYDWHDNGQMRCELIYNINNDLISAIYWSENGTIVLNEVY